MRVLIAGIILVIGQFGFGQDVMGRIVDSETSDPLIGASVVIIYESDSIMVTSDINGVFTIEENEGLVKLSVSYLGYKAIEKLYQGDSNLTIAMAINESNIAVNPIIIANPFLGNDISFNRKEFQVMPGAYEDPSRLVLKAPGFATSNDQANSILYKGMPSNFVNWTVNGALIVNPNHLSNAGTLSDVSSASAGGVNAFSGQVIGTYDFQSAPYSVPFNNAIAGNSNITFSEFNNTYLNLSLVGLEAGVGNDYFQLNYRYSFVGILTGGLGLDFGGEDIRYQDLFGRFNLLNKADEKLTAHIVLGRSSNTKPPIMDIDSAETYKEIVDIRFDSDILVSGLNYENKKGLFDLKAAVNYSVKQDSRRFNDGEILRESQLNTIDQQVISGLLQFSNESFSFGLNTHFLSDSRELSFGSIELASGFSSTENFNFTPFVKYQFEKNWYYLEASSGFAYNSISQNFNLEPGFKFVGRLPSNFEVEFGQRRNTQIIPRGFNAVHDVEEVIGNHFDLTLRYKKKGYVLYGSLFTHQMSNILAETNSNYSQYTGIDKFFLEDYSFDGTAYSQGFTLGLSTNNLFTKGLSISTNYTNFDSKFGKNGENIIDNTFDFDYSFNFVSSYNRALSKHKDLVISLAYHQRGGLKEFAIDYSDFLAANPQYSFNNGTMSTLEDYSRIDFRIVYNLRKSSERRFAKSISLDIQNLGNRENDAFTNYDFLTGSPFVQKQLGLIPVLAYRIEF